MNRQGELMMNFFNIKKAQIDLSKSNAYPIPATQPGTKSLNKPMQLKNCLVTVMGNTMQIQSATNSFNLTLTPEQLEIVISEFAE
jgi:hypothetical protein